MKYLLVMTAAVLTTVVSARKYSSRHDKLDIDRLINTPGYMKASVECYLDRGDCDKITAMLKKAVPEIVLLACGKCTPTQKYILRRYLEELKSNLPQEYAAFRQKYDPDDMYFDTLEQAISEAYKI